MKEGEAFYYWRRLGVFFFAMRKEEEYGMKTSSSDFRFFVTTTLPFFCSFALAVTPLGGRLTNPAIVFFELLAS